MFLLGFIGSLNNNDSWIPAKLWIPARYFLDNPNYYSLLSTWEIFWIKSLNGSSNQGIWSPKNSNFIEGFKSVILAIFQRELGWLCPGWLAQIWSQICSRPFSTGSKESLTGIKFFFVHINNSKAKIERAHSNFRVQSGKITMCSVHADAAHVMWVCTGKKGFFLWTWLCKCRQYCFALLFFALQVHLKQKA